MESRQQNYRMQKREYRKPQESTEGKRQKASMDQGKIIQDDYTKTEYGIEARQLQNAKVNSSEFQDKILNNKIRI